MHNSIIASRTSRAIDDMIEYKNAGPSERVSHPCVDTITGLPNRAMLNWYLEHLYALKPEPPLNSALMVITLNEMKAMRYAFGDYVCNQFSCVAAQRIRAIAEPGHFISTLSDGEFAFVISRSTGREECTEIARRLLVCLGEPISIDGRGYFSSANIGIAVADVRAEMPTDILHRAQAVLSEARLEGCGEIRFADRDSAKSVSDELSMLNEVRGACQRGELYLHYQPIFDLRTDEIRGVEALLRWNSQHFGEVPPDRFIPLLEQCGGILAIGEWVLRAVCRQARIWNQTSASAIRVSVNVSAIQLEAADFETRLVSILAETRCRPDWIELEITESAAVKVMARVRERLMAIADRGITIAIDDFGAGYSSFGQLASMPVHHLKLDRALLANLPHDRKGVAIIRAIKILCSTLGMTLTIEGIERHDQRLFCEQAGLEQGQGFLFGTPTSSGEIEVALTKANARIGIAA